MISFIYFLHLLVEIVTSPPHFIGMLAVFVWCGEIFLVSVIRSFSCAEQVADNSNYFHFCDFFSLQRPVFSDAYVHTSFYRRPIRNVLPWLN